MGIQDYDPRILPQLVEFAYRKLMVVVNLVENSVLMFPIVLRLLIESVGGLAIVFLLRQEEGDRHRRCKPGIANPIRSIFRWTTGTRCVVGDSAQQECTTFAADQVAQRTAPTRRSIQFGGQQCASPERQQQQQ